MTSVLFFHVAAAAAFVGQYLGSFAVLIQETVI